MSGTPVGADACDLRPALRAALGVVAPVIRRAAEVAERVGVYPRVLRDVLGTASYLLDSCASPRHISGAEALARRATVDLRDFVRLQWEKLPGAVVDAARAAMHLTCATYKLAALERDERGATSDQVLAEVRAAEEVALSCARALEPAFDVEGAVRRLRAEYDDVVEVSSSDHRGRLSHTGRAFASNRGDRGDHRLEEWLRIDQALALGLRDEGDLRRLLAALGWSKNCAAWHRVVVGEIADDVGDV